jgi:PAS domain S-box-containing protein
MDDKQAKESMRHGASDYLLKDRLARLGPAITQAMEKKSLHAHQHQTTQHLAIEIAVSRALIETTTLDEAVQAILSSVCRMLGWDWAALWLLDESIGLLHCTAVWHPPTIQAPEFDTGTRLLTLSRGSGLPGRAWESASPVFIADAASNPDFYRAPIAAREGFHGGVAFPVQVGGRVIGIIEMFSRDIRHLGDDLVALLTTTGNRIGQEIEHRRAETALRHSEERFRQLAENITEVFWMTDTTKSQILYISPGYERIWGRTCQSLYTSPRLWNETIHPEDRARVISASLRQVLGTYEEEYRIVRPDGTIRWIRDRAFPVRDDTGAVYRIAGIAEDVTERRFLSSQLRQSQKMEIIGQLAGGVAHDFNNVLTVILGYTQLLLAGERTKESWRSHVEEIKRAGERAASLTYQLLAFSRQQLLELRVMELNRVVEGMETLLRRLIGENIELDIHCPPSSGRVKIDPGRIEQVILNLAVNARDAMPSGGRLTIETDSVELSEEEAEEYMTLSLEPGPYERLIVSDTGCGIDAQTQTRIFEPFFTTKRAGKGTGLGLSTVYGIVRQCRGGISVHSQVDKGSTFTIYLPRVTDDPAPQPKQPESEIPLTRGSETVLLVEDEEMVRTLTRRVLTAQGYVVLEAQDASDALHKCYHHEGPIHLLITDMVLPGVSGQTLAERLIELYPRLKVLYMSGYPDQELTSAGPNERIAYLQKPFTHDVLMNKVHETLHRRS